jgi:hypothetical protein
MSASIVLGQVAKTIFAYAALTGWFLSALFCVLAIVHSIKAYVVK